MVRDYRASTRFFFIKEATGTDKGRPRTLKSCIGNLTVTEKQAKKLEIEKFTRLAPFFKKCCLRLAANLSYENVEQEIEIQTGVKVGHSSIHNLVNTQNFSEQTAVSEVRETSVDGGKVRVRGEKGSGCRWLDYKAVRLHESLYAAYFQDNEALVNYVNSQPLNSLLTCLGDGHDGIWNIIENFNPNGERREILDWYHLMENLHKVGGSNKRLEQAEKFLWEGLVDETIKLFESCGHPQAEKFCKYINKHRHRIVNYKLLSSEKICSIGSGAVESAVKQIDKRLKLPGAQWVTQNVNQMLKLTCAYLNDAL